MSRPLILDTQLLLLFIAGTTNKKSIAVIKRLSGYSVEDFDLLIGLARNFNKLILTPNTVTETSNLLRLGRQTSESRDVATRMSTFLGQVGEIYVESASAASHPKYLALGITDAVLLTVCESGGMLLTADLDLYLAAIRAKHTAMNFNHLRDRYRA